MQLRSYHRQADQIKSDRCLTSAVYVNIFITSRSFIRHITMKLWWTPLSASLCIFLFSKEFLLPSWLSQSSQLIDGYPDEHSLPAQSMPRASNNKMYQAALHKPCYRKQCKLNSLATAWRTKIFCFQWILLLADLWRFPILWNKTNFSALLMGMLGVNVTTSQTGYVPSQKHHLQLNDENVFPGDGCDGTPSLAGPLATAVWLLWHRSPTLDAMSTKDTRSS